MSAAKLSLAQAITRHALAGTANAAFWDQTLTPNADTLEFDRSRVGNAFANFLLGAAGYRGLSKNFNDINAVAGIAALGAAPYKDLAINTNRALKEVSTIKETANATARRDMMRLGLGGLALTGGGVLGYKGYRALKDRSVSENQGSIKVTLQTEDPTDQETVLELPFQSGVISNSMRENLERDLRRRLRSGTRERARRRDPETGELISMSEFNRRYGNLKVATQQTYRPPATPPSPFRTPHGIGADTGAEDLRKDPKPIIPMFGPQTQFSPQPVEAEAPVKPEEPKPNPYIAHRTKSMERRLSKLALFKQADWMDTLGGYSESVLDPANYNAASEVLGVAGRPIDAIAGAGREFARGVYNIGANAKSNMEGVGGNLAEAYGGFFSGGGRLNPLQRFGRLGKAGWGVAKTPFRMGADTLMALAGGTPVGMGINAAVDQLSGYTHEKNQPAPVADAPARADYRYGDVFETVKGISSVAGNFIPGLKGIGTLDLSDYRARTGQPPSSGGYEEIAKRIRMLQNG